MAGSITAKLNKALGARIISSKPLPGGDIADVSLLGLDNHTYVVAKRPRIDQPDTTSVEAKMLKHLEKTTSVPIPKVLFQASGILVISYIPNNKITDPISAANSTAQHIAALHSVTAKTYGFKDDTFIGSLPQINTISTNWIDFFRDNRLLAMAQSCVNTGRIEASLMQRIEGLAAKLPDIIPNNPTGSLLHGDLWAGNMLFKDSEIAGFIDPAISYGHKEMDLAFIDLMGGLNITFWDNYSDHSVIDAGFHEERKFIYQLWPLLVHVRLFGGGYVNDISNILERFGC